MESLCAKKASRTLSRPKHEYGLGIQIPHQDGPPTTKKGAGASKPTNDVTTYPLRQMSQTRSARFDFVSDEVNDRNHDLR